MNPIINIETNCPLNIPEGYRLMDENEIVRKLDMVLSQHKAEPEWGMVDSDDIGYPAWFVGDFCIRKLKLK